MTALAVHNGRSASRLPSSWRLAKTPESKGDDEKGGEDKEDRKMDDGLIDLTASLASMKKFAKRPGETGIWPEAGVDVDDDAVDERLDGLCGTDDNGGKVQVSSCLIVYERLLQMIPCVFVPACASCTECILSCKCAIFIHTSRLKVAEWRGVYVGIGDHRGNLERRQKPSRASSFVGRKTRALKGPFVSPQPPGASHCQQRGLGITKYTLT